LSLEDDIKILQKVELFSDFDSEQLRLIAFGSQKLNYSSDVEIFHEGQSASGGYVIMEGSVDLLQHKKKEPEHLGTYSAGSILGELSLITSNRRRATAITRTDTVLLSIPRTVMMRILSEYPNLAVTIKEKIQHSITTLLRRMDSVPHNLTH